VQEMARLTWYFVDGCDIARVPQPRSRTASRAPTADPKQCSADLHVRRSDWSG
jgi:hypothetical protein